MRQFEPMQDPLLSRVPWSRAFARVAYERGLRYAAEGRVMELRRLDAEGLRWTASVKGSEPEPYHVEAELVPASGAHDWTLHSTCTCPVHSLCKHAAATLRAAEEQQQDAASQASGAAANDPAADAAAAIDAWDDWLEQLQPAAAATVAPADHVGLLLRAAAVGDPPQLLVAVVAFERGVHGQLTRPRSIVTQHGNPSLAPRGGWPEADLLPVMLLLTRQTERVGALSFAALRGQAAERAFEHLLQRYPACYERGSRRLAAAPARRLALRWRDLPDGGQQLEYAPEDGGTLRVLRGDGLWYIDDEAASIGRLDADRQLYESLRDAPELAPEQVDALQARLAQAPLPIPAPRRRAPPRALSAKPKPRLQLRGFTPPASARPGSATAVELVGVGRLCFDYAGVTLDAAGPLQERRLRKGEMVEIARDPTAERVHIERLRSLDLVSRATLPWPLSYSYAPLAPDDLLLAPGSNRQPQPAEAWNALLRTLAAEGWSLDYESGFPRPLREIQADEWDAELSEQAGSWFDLRLGIDVEGQRLDLLPILRQLLADPRFPMMPARGERPNARWRVALDDERAVLLPLARLRALLAPLLEWLQRDEGGVRLHRSQGQTLQALEGVVLWRGDAQLQQRMLDLRERPTELKAPPGFGAKLRPYQRDGLAWLEYLADAGLGGVLADDMGLGKTVQVLAHLLMQRQQHGEGYRALVVAPTSLMGNWRDEAARFAPALKVLVLHGPDRGDRYDEITSHDLILTTYPLLPRDRERLLQHEFDLLVLDEAQAIKNARSQAAQVVRELRARRRLAMTGTPLENHLGELWAQFDAVEPGLLGSEREFTRFYRTPIEKHADRERQQRLHRRIGALMLRRRKDEVLKELPPKTEIVRSVELEGAQRELYETLRLAQHARVREAIAERGLGQSGIVVLDALLKLRQACCDPRLVQLPAARKVEESAKLDALGELLDTLLDEGRRVLLFSQFTSMLDLIEPLLRERGTEYLRLDGNTPGTARSGLVQRFQRGGVPLFLISLKAGGVGLNLTAADTVIHYDPWWNPAVERQATDRAHRIGQNKAVFVYKLICADTVEAKILSMQERKSDLAQAVLEGGRSTELRFDEADLAELFAPLR